jgi:hypothetical protein
MSTPSTSPSATAGFDITPSSSSNATSTTVIVESELGTSSEVKEELGSAVVPSLFSLWLMMSDLPISYNIER